MRPVAHEMSKAVMRNSKSTETERCIKHPVFGEFQKTWGFLGIIVPHTYRFVLRKLYWREEA
jgi:hypothetical protein